MSSLPAFLDQISAITVTDVVPFGGRPFEVRGHVFVGCGTWPDPGLTLPTDHLVLNNKRAGSRFQHKFPSVIKLLEAPPPGLLESWETWADRPLMPAQALQRITLVAEDASPDSVFGILLLLGRLAGLEPHQLPSGWIEAVDEWERTGVADEPQRSWCALASALAHARFPVGSQPSAEVLAAAWTDLLRFAAACIAAHVSPRAMPDLRSIKEWRDARSALHQEERVYLDWLQQATIAQLSLPLSFSPDRRLLLDSLFITEYQPTGSAKVFYRNDTARSPLGKGFSLAAHYRPAERGTGNDITIAVDPRIGVNLRDLWSELERRENEAWANAGETRLDCEPRWPDRADCRWNEPWFINDDGTLIGAPHKLATDQFGTKLSWQDILAAIWAVYNPLLDVKVCRIGSDHPIPLLQLTPEATARDGAESASVDHGKRLLCASWPRSPTPTQGAGPRALGQAPIVPRRATLRMAPICCCWSISSKSFFDTATTTSARKRRPSCRCCSKADGRGEFRAPSRREFRSTSR
jgi:hypothetical protein